MAEEIASGYISIGPALTKDFKAKLDQQLQPVATQAGQVVGQRTAEAIPTGLSAGAPALRKSGQQIGSTVATTAAASVSTGLANATPGMLARFRQRFSQGFTNLARSGGFSAIASSIGEIATTAIPQLDQMRQSSNRVTGAIGGTANAAGSVLPGALAIGAAAFAVWQTAQENARKAAEDFAGTLDRTTGSSTLQTYQLAAERFVKEFSLEDLQTTPLTLDEITRALVRGGDELTGVMAKLQAARDAEVKAAGLDFVAANQAAEKYNRLSNAVNNLANDNRASAEVWRAAKAATEAASAASDGATASNNTLAGSANNAAAALDREGMKARDLRTHLSQVPRSITVTVATNINAVALAALAAIRALKALGSLGGGAQYSAGAAINDYVAGINSGKYEDAISKAARLAQEAADAAAKANKAASSASGSAASSAASGANAAANAAKAAAEQRAQEIAQARQQLQQTIAGVVQGARETGIPRVTALPRSAPGIVRALQKQLFTLRRFKYHLNLLAKRGLPKVFLQQLIDAGLDGAETAAALARAKDTDFNQIKRLTSALNTESGKLGDSSVRILYGTGKNAVRALVAGMDAEQRLVEYQMLKIAKGMEKAIKKALGIKSPSRVFLGIGRNVADATVIGMEQRRPAVDRAVAGLVSAPGARRVPSYAYGAAGGGAAPLITGGLHMHNPIEKTLNGSATDALRQTAFLLGQSA